MTETDGERKGGGDATSTSERAAREPLIKAPERKTRETANMPSISSKLSVKHRKIPEKGLVVHEFNGGVFPASAIGAKISKEITRRERPTKATGGSRAAELKASSSRGSEGRGAQRRAPDHLRRAKDRNSRGFSSSKSGSLAAGGIPEASKESLNAARACHNLMPRITQADYKIDVWPSNRPQSNSYTPTTEVSAWNNSTNTEFRQTGDQSLLSPGRVGFQSIPGFLLEIQEFIQQELDILTDLEVLDSASSLDMRIHRLQTFAQVFDCIIDRFQTYGPTLAVVKKEYESFIQWALEENQRVHKLSTKVTKMEERQAKEIHEVQKHAADAVIEREALLSKVQQYSGMKYDMSEDLENLESSNDELKDKVKKLQEIRNVLLAQMERQEREIENLNQEVTLNETEKVRIDKKFTKEIEELKAENEQLRQELRDIERDNKNAETDAENRIRKLAKINEDLEEEMEEKDRRLAESEELVRAHTPKPDWSDILEGEENLQGRVADCTSTKSAIQLIVDTYVTGLHVASRHTTGEEPWIRQFFEGMGSDREVPKFLRHSGKVRNRFLSKNDTELLIRDIWQQKEKFNRKESLAEHVFWYLKNKFGIHQTIVENGYNLFYALQKYQDDPDIELFQSVLNGQASEDVYYEEKKLLKDIITVCESHDIKETGKVTGSLPKEDFKTIISEFFEDKPRKAVESLFQALEEDEPGPMVKYKNLFADDRDLRQSTFAEMLRFQHLNARKKYLSELERILKENAQEDHVSIGDMRRAILNIDPAKDEDELRDMIARATKVPYQELFTNQEFKKDGVTMFPVKLFMKNLKEGTGVVRSVKRERNRVKSTIVMMETKSQ
ncbi:translin-associated factor X-interacting domain-containing protein [Chloropicon primus]|uniref:Translin-associated factor X-interacting protein 1 N-terminal domain-containing protein n=2 Tax=Chloropicon primus TaxID=1764295 RepID=A0A5B8MHK8_9CHLO|nr:hypothetical protein A3770_03p24740 [Chloropicon primus]UPQ99167.1 translin-associated factor X-interacting domain-containing protein [Chloropicon primus]|eukprot:QDZ19956.1 hypothetical protein A3770_03p24740 [Chloropicon primus]